MAKGNGQKRAPRNSKPLTFGKAVDALECMRANEERERVELLAALKERQALRRLAILDRCDGDTKSRVIKHMEPGDD